MLPIRTEARRVHTALTAKAERRLLIWLAERTPAWINSDYLTGLALLAQMAAGASYVLAARHASALWLVNLFLFLNWLGDSLDGTLARVRNRQRPRYGFYLDHVADAVGALALMAGLGGSGYVHWPVAVGMLICFYLLSIESYLAAYAIGDFHISHGLMGPTEIRILLAIGNVFLIGHREVILAGRKFLLFDAGGAIAIVAMAAMAVIATVRHTARLYREEPLA